MANMSYCRWQNTAVDFDDCLQSLQDKDPTTLSNDEFRAYLKVLKMSQELLDYNRQFDKDPAAEEPEDE